MMEVSINWHPWRSATGHDYLRVEVEYSPRPGAKSAYDSQNIPADIISQLRGGLSIFDLIERFLMPAVAVQRRLATEAKNTRERVRAAEAKRASRLRLAKARLLPDRPAVANDA